MNTRLWAVARKELIQLRRDRLTVAMMAGIPVIQLLLFGYAINTDVRHIPTVVLDQDWTTPSREFPQHMVASGYYDLVGHVRSYGEIERAMHSGQARVALVIPAGYGQAIERGRRGTLQLIVDGTDPQVVGSATQTAAGIAQAQSAELVASKWLGGTLPTIQVEPLVWFNPELRTAVFVVPGLTGVILTMTMVMLTAMAIARERERGTLELIMVSPVTRLELTLGKIIPYIGIGYGQMALILSVGHLVFDVPLAGSLLLLFGLAFVFISANLALGLTFSTIAKTQQQAMQMSFFFLLPNILLSGFMFPWEAMPAPARWLAQALPLTHFLRIARGIALKGAHFPELVGELIWLCCILVVLTALAAARFQKRLG